MAVLPQQMSQMAAGLDLASMEEDTRVPPHSTLMFGTGLVIEIPPNYFGLIKERSSFGKIGITISGGVIDSDYRGEVMMLITNNTANLIKIFQYARVAQLLLIPRVMPKVQEVKELSDTS